VSIASNEDLPAASQGTGVEKSVHFAQMAEDKSLHEDAFKDASEVFVACGDGCTDEASIIAHLPRDSDQVG
jgi:hypothetical protein